MQERVKRVMSQVLGVPAESVGSESSQESIPRWDSLGHMNLCLALEEEFQVSFEPDEVVRMTNFQAIVETLAGRA